MSDDSDDAEPRVNDGLLAAAFRRRAEQSARCPRCQSPMKASGEGSTVRFLCAVCKTNVDATALVEGSPDLGPDAALSVEDAARRPENLFGKFVLIKKVGEGSFGEVYRAWQRDLSRYVALKILRSEDPKLVRRFAREAEMLAAIAHPNVVPLHEISVEKGRHYISMEYVEKDPYALTDDPRTAAKAVSSVARTLQHIHEHGIVHRDVKPGNILLGKDGRVRITDFGLAKPFEPGKTLTQEGSFVGTPAYMAPEQMMGVRCDTRADVYSLGATLYTFLTGRLPYEGESAAAILVRALRGDPIPPSRWNPRVTPALESILFKAMSSVLDERYGSAQEMADDLDGWLKGLPMRPASSRRKVAKRFRWPAVTGAALGLALALLVLVPKFTRSDAPGALVPDFRQAWAYAVRHLHDLPDADTPPARAAASEEWKRKATAEFEKIRAAPRSDTEKRIAASFLAYQAGRHTEAVAQIADVAVKSEFPEGVPLLMAASLLALGRTTEAETALSEAVDRSSEFAGALRLRASIRYAAGRFTEAEADVTRALAIDGRDAALWVLRSRLDYQNQRYGAGVDAARNAVGLEPSYAGYLLLASHCSKLDRSPEAMEAYRSAVSLAVAFEGDHVGYMNRGDVKRAMGDRAGALEDLTSAIAIKPEFGRAYLVRSLVHGELKDDVRMLSDLNEAIARLNPDKREETPYWVAALARRGRHRLLHKEVPGALADLTRALERTPDDPLLLVDRGQCYLHLKRHQESVTDLTRAFRLRPNLPEIAQRTLDEAKRRLAR